jgi:hypothetical protein
LAAKPIHRLAAAAVRVTVSGDATEDPRYAARKATTIAAGTVARKIPVVTRIRRR